MSEPAAHPVRLIVTDDLERSRLTVFFRLLLAIPHFLWFALFTVAAVVLVIISWFATLFTGRSPKALHDFLAGYLRYGVHVSAYALLGANPFPAFYVGSDLKPYPVDVEIAPPVQQNRWKTFFRPFLGIPALIVSTALSGGGSDSTARSSFSMGVGTAAAFLTWFAALATGRAPRGLRDALAWGFGYSAQTYAYLLLLTDRYPYAGPEAHLEAAAPPEAEGRAQVVVTDDLRRSRLTVFFRLLLAVPHAVWFALWSVVLFLLLPLNWIAALAIGRSPQPFARFIAAYIRYTTHLGAFLTLVGNPFPGFTGAAGSYPVDVELDPFADQRRLITVFRLFLAVPSLFIASAASSVLWTAAFLAWFASLVTGREPQGLRNAGAWALGYTAQVDAYLFCVTDRYPFSSPTSTWRAG